MADHREVLASTESILLIDYPGRIVPDTLARAGYTVVAHEGPGPDEYRSYSFDGTDVTQGPAGPAPAHTDLVFAYRPIEELPGIVEEAARLGARAVWTHHDGPPSDDERSRTREIVEGAGLVHVDAPALLDAVAER